MFGVENMGCSSEKDDPVITVLRGEDGLGQLKEAWQKIHSGLSCPGYHRDWRWMASLQRHLMDEPLVFVVLRRHGRVAIILPLQLRSGGAAGFKHRFISFPYHNHIVLSDALIDPSVAEERDLARLFAFLETQKEFKWNHMRLNGMVEGSLLHGALVASGYEPEQTSFNAYFDWPTGKYDATLSKKHIRNTRRLTQKAESELGPVQVRFVSGPAELPDALETFFELEASGWKGEKGTSTAIKNDERLIVFYRDLLTRFSEDKSFQINLLEINGVPAAGQMCIRCGSVWYILKVGYNDRLKQYGAGNALMLACLERLSQDAEISELNLVTSPAWADRWHLNKRPVYSLQHFNRGIGGRMLKALRDSKRKLKLLTARQ